MSVSLEIAPEVDARPSSTSILARILTRNLTEKNEHQFKSDNPLFDSSSGTAPPTSTAPPTRFSVSRVPSAWLGGARNVGRRLSALFSGERETKIPSEAGLAPALEPVRKPAPDNGERVLERSNTSIACRNPMLRRVLNDRQVNRRIAKDIAHLYDESPRRFFIELSRLRLQAGEFVSDKERIYTTAFLGLHGRTLWVMVGKGNLQRSSPITSATIAATSVIFTSVLSSSVHASLGGFTRESLVPAVLGGSPHGIKGEILFNWGAATRCLVTQVDGGTIVSSMFISESLDTFYATVFALAMVCGDNELFIGWWRYLSVTILGNLAGTLCALAVLGQYTPVIGCAGSLSVHALMYVARTVSEPGAEGKTLARSMRAITALGLFIFFAIMGGRAAAVHALGGALVGIFPCYLMSSMFFSERVDSILWAVGAVLTTTLPVIFGIVIAARGCA